MIRHYVAWSHLDTLSAEEKTQNAAKIKAGLEALVGVVPGLLSMQVCISPVAGHTTHDMMLESTFACKEDMESYIIHPRHKEMSAFIRTVIHNRFCFDREE